MIRSSPMPGRIGLARPSRISTSRRSRASDIFLIAKTLKAPPGRSRGFFSRLIGAESLDQFVGAGKQHRRALESERLRGLEIDHRLELGRRLHRQLTRLLTLEDAVDIGRRPSEH